MFDDYSILEIQDMDKKVQEILRKLNLKAELLQEYKESRAFSGSVKMLLERASKREAQGSVPGQVRSVGLGLGSTNGQGQRSWRNHPSVDSPPNCPPQLFPNLTISSVTMKIKGYHLHSESQGHHQSRGQLLQQIQLDY